VLREGSEPLAEKKWTCCIKKKRRENKTRYRETEADSFEEPAWPVYRKVAALEGRASINDSCWVGTGKKLLPKGKIFPGETEAAKQGKKKKKGKLFCSKKKNGPKSAP